MDKETLLKMSVEERLKTIRDLDVEEVTKLVEDGEFLDQISQDIKNNPELVKKLKEEVNG